MLRVAPVKGLGTITPQRVQIDEMGVAEDRRLFLLDAAGAVVTLRSHPQLVQVVPDLDLEQGVLRVRLPHGDIATSVLSDAAHEVHAELYGKHRRGRVLGGDVPAALSAHVGVPVRVVLADRTGVGWDEGPVSIISRSSAAAVGGDDRDRARYRMLVELDETDPYEEDTWVGREVALGDARVRVTHPLQRCVIITQSPQTGQQDWDGLRRLAEVRDRDLLLGVIAEVVSPGVVSVGATAQLVET